MLQPLPDARLPNPLPNPGDPRTKGWTPPPQLCCLRLSLRVSIARSGGEVGEQEPRSTPRYTDTPAHRTGKKLAANQLKMAIIRAMPPISSAVPRTPFSEKLPTHERLACRVVIAEGSAREKEGERFCCATLYPFINHKNAMQHTVTLFLLLLPSIFRIYIIYKYLLFLGSNQPIQRTAFGTASFEA